MFLSSFENKIDKKGRVSVPATFRSYLNSLGYNGFISYPSFNHPALEACSQDRIEKLSGEQYQLSEPKGLSEPKDPIDVSKQNLNDLHKALFEYRVRIGRYPTEDDGGLMALLKKPEYEKIDR